LYFPLNEKGERAGNPFKASLFGKNTGLPTLELHFAKSKEALKDHPTKPAIKTAITSALKSISDEPPFKNSYANRASM